MLPHEVAWLQQVQQFQDADNREILETLACNCHNPRRPVAFRPGTDKRKYSNLMQWVRQRLASIVLPKSVKCRTGRSQSWAARSAFRV